MHRHRQAIVHPLTACGERSRSDSNQQIARAKTAHPRVAEEFFTQLTSATHEPYFGKFLSSCKDPMTSFDHIANKEISPPHSHSCTNNSRGGKAVRLTYDHKGSDAQEAKRITDAGGFVMNHRVNGVLAVTRSLGDTAMKEFVVGSPYTTETVLGSEDAFLIIACDGVSTLHRALSNRLGLTSY